MELAKECFVEALALDVKNYDAFRELVEGGMMSSTEGKRYVTVLRHGRADGYQNGNSFATCHTANNCPRTKPTLSSSCTPPS
jgi:hypothetical protein